MNTNELIRSLSMAMGGCVNSASFFLLFAMLPARVSLSHRGSAERTRSMIAMPRSQCMMLRGGGMGGVPADGRGSGQDRGGVSSTLAAMIREMFLIAFPLVSSQSICNSILNPAGRHVFSVVTGLCSVSPAFFRFPSRVFLPNFMSWHGDGLALLEGSLQPSLHTSDAAPHPPQRRTGRSATSPRSNSSSSPVSPGHLA